MIAGYIFLLIAILSEAAAAAMLKISDGFARWQPSVLVVIGYGLAFYMMSLTLQVIPLSLSYATWSGAGHRSDCNHRRLVVSRKAEPAKYRRHYLSRVRRCTDQFVIRRRMS